MLNSSNILDVISSVSTYEINNILPFALNNSVSINKNISNKRLILKSNAYAGLLQFSGEYEYDADQINESKMYEENVKNLKRRCFSIVKNKCVNLTLEVEMSLQYERQKSMFDLSISGLKVFSPKEMAAGSKKFLSKYLLLSFSSSGRSTNTFRRKLCNAFQQYFDTKNISTIEVVSCLKKPYNPVRRAFGTIGAVKDQSENLLQTLRIPSIEESDGSEKHEFDEKYLKEKNKKDLEKDSFKIKKEKEKLIFTNEYCQKKQRSKSLAGVLSTVHKGEKMSGLFPYNIRSDSVDSGFSCTSSSSNSLFDEFFSLKKPRLQSASIVVGKDSTVHLQGATDFLVWLKFVKLTKKLKSVTLHKKEVKKSTVVLDKLINQNVKVENVKKFVRHNDWPVSHEIRADLWHILCHNKDFNLNKLLYSQQLEDLTKSGVKTFRPSFLSMDGIVIHDHGLKEEGAVTLQRLLIVIECVRPEIRYVPILYPLCSMFLHYLSAEETFACIIRLLSQSHTFVQQSELAVYASCHTLLSLLKKHKKPVYTLLKRRAGTSDDNKLAEVFSQWNAWIFKFMPFEYLVRVIDCFFVEGHKMLLRVALSLVYIWYKERSRDFPRPLAASGNNSLVNNNNNKNNNNNNNMSRFLLLRSTAMPLRGKQSIGAKGEGAINLAKNLSTVDQNIAEINEQIIAIAQNCPISVHTLLDIGWAIRNFKHSTIENLQKYYENKFRDEVARIRSEKAVSRPLRSIYTAAFASKIIDTEAASELMGILPSRFQLETPELLFRLSEHGASFVQLWALIDEAEQSLLIIRSTSGAIFGAYCSSCWGERRDVRERAKTRYFGTGESFVWLLHDELQLPVVYKWAGQNSEHPDACPQMFMTAGDKYLIIGSGGTGDAIAIRDELTSGLSYPCDTFESPNLVKGNAFEIDEMEVFMVVSSGGRAG